MWFCPEFQIPDLFPNMLFYAMDPDHNRKTQSKFEVVFSSDDKMGSLQP